MKTRILPLLALFLCMQHSFAQELSSVGTTDSTSIKNLFLRQIAAFPQEKIHIQTDKSAYVVGDTLWMRIHLVDALLLKQANASRYVYVELLNPLANIIERVMIRPDSLGYFYGHLPVDEALPEGNYTLRAYTRYMQNLGEEYFFRKSIHIIDPTSEVLSPVVAFSWDGKKVNTDIHFTRSDDGTKVLPQGCSVLLNEDDVEAEGKKVAFGSDSVAHYSFNVKEDGPSGVLLLKVEYQGKKYNRFFHIPASDDQFDVAFFPEGGQAPVLSNIQIAFKALNANGLSEEVSGVIYDDTGKEYVTFRSEHLGMGHFMMYYQPGRTYHAVCTNRKGVSKRFNLPEAVPDAVSLKTLWDRNYLRVTLSKPTGVTLPFQAYLVAHIRGAVIYSEPWDEARGFLTFEKDYFPAGIVHFMLIDGERNILSERLVFSSQRSTFATVEVISDKDNYAPREKIGLKVKMTDENKTPLSGNFSMAVVDKRTVEIDSTNTILSTLLLTSELKGYIESPMSYLNKNNRNAMQALDILMMTQGWRRYNVPEVLKGRLTGDLKYPLESERVISGKAEGIFSALKGGHITMTTRGEVVGSEVAELDQARRFMFHHTEYPDKTWYILQATTKKGGQTAFIELDSMPGFPPVTLPVMYPANNIQKVMPEYVAQENQKYTLENGMRVVNLAEVSVFGVVKQKEKVGTSSPYYSVNTSKVITAKDIEKSHYNSIYDMFRFLPGVSVIGETVLYHQASPMIIVDDVPRDDFDYSILDVSDISDVFVSPPVVVMPIFGSRAANGAIVINTKRGTFVEKNKLNKNMQVIKPIGYQQTIEFYSPEYETETDRNKAAKDLRSTIYWKPNVVVDDTGMATLNFYSADSSSEYGIIIEGTSDQGHLIYSGTRFISVEKYNE